MRCECPICVTNQALKRLSTGLDVYVESLAEMEGDLYYLWDEVQDFLKGDKTQDDLAKTVEYLKHIQSQRPVWTKRAHVEERDGSTS